jgi:hypothetical protein
MNYRKLLFGAMFVCASVLVHAQFGYPDQAARIDLYPNPAHQQFNLAGNGVQIFGLRIYNVLGNLVDSQRYQVNDDRQNLQVDVQSLESGIYYLHISTDQGELVKKLILY